MNTDDIQRYFRETLHQDRNKSEAVAAIETLLEFITLDNAVTLLGLIENIRGAIKALTTTEDSVAVTSINSGCELFLRFITLAGADVEGDFQVCKKIFLQRGTMFLKKLETSRKKISRMANPFIQDGATILVHSRSRVILQVLEEAVNQKKRFTVYVTESYPDKSGHDMQRDLTNLGIPAVVILDSAVGYIMEKVDFILVGAEGVVESGGIINKIGTFTIAVCAKHMNKPVYVVAESFKFARLFPLNQNDVPDQFKYKASKLSSNIDLTHEHPNVDYTPPALLTLLFTDLGILTPSAVSDELIKLYL